MLVRSYSKHLLIESLAAIRYFGGQCHFNSPVVNELNHALRIIGTNLESTFSKVVLKCIVLKPYTCQYFQVKHCNDLGISADKSSTLYLFIGIFATVGRLGGGFLCNIKSVKAIRSIVPSGSVYRGNFYHATDSDENVWCTGGVRDCVQFG